MPAPVIPIQKKQVFETRSRWRWVFFKWTGRLLLLTCLAMAVLVVVSLGRGRMPHLPELFSGNNTAHHMAHPFIPPALNKKDLEKYKGISEFLLAREKNERLRNKPAAAGKTSRIHAAFYVDWDPQSFFSLQRNIGHLDMVLPEWFFIDPDTDTLRPDMDMAALQLMKRSNVKIVPLINNINPQKGVGEFDGTVLHRILHQPAKKERLIADIIKYLQRYQLQGINIDFEEFSETGDGPIIAFQKQLYQRLHAAGFLVTQDIMPDNKDFNVKELSAFNDYMFLMAYDEHYNSSVPGDISSQRWVEKVLDETAAEVPSEKIVLCMAGYGYDWAGDAEAATITYQQALATAKQFNTTPDFDNDTYNNHYSYTDGGIKHQVYFTDAATSFNLARFAAEYGTAGTALWRLGSEDERMWTYYDRDLSLAALRCSPFDITQLEYVKTPVDKPDYIGEGEVLNVVASPEPGRIALETDSTEQVISEQQYLQMPTRYVIKKYGVVHNQVLLTFDDGPDPVYTPQVLDILKKEQVPATFFIVGMEAENNLPLLERIYREGHEIGNHTFTHPNMAAVGHDRALTEMESTRLLLEAVTGHSTVLFRAPYNADAEPSTEVELKPVALSRQKNYYTVGESIDPEDWEEGITADSVYARTIRQYEAHPEKGIILLHDAGGNRQATVDALPRIIKYFKQRNIAFTNVAGLLHVPKSTVMPEVHDGLVQLDGKIAHVGYWAERLLAKLFWLAIILGLGRVSVLLGMALVQKMKKNKTLPVAAGNTPPAVSIIVPAYNEEVNAVKTISNLLQQDYPVFDIVFVDDGSKDETFARVCEAFKNHKQVKLFTKPNGGKASALNYGIARTNSEYVVCIDADTQLSADAVTQLIKKITADASGRTGAVAGNVKVGNENNLLTRWQSIEYTTAQNFDRRAFDLVNGITVVPGAIGAFRRQAIEDAGGFTSDTLAEDCDLTIRILRCGYRVANCNEALAITEAPETLKQFMKQRFRWSYGIMQAFWKNRDACFNPKYKGLGLLALPNILLFQVILPLLAPLADMALVFSLIWNRHSPASLQKTGGYYLLFLAAEMLVSIIAFAFEKEKFSKLLWLIPQRFVYRQLMYVILFKAIRRALKGEQQGWGVLKRTGNVRQVSIATQ